MQNTLKQITKLGGAQIGKINATFPFARLFVNPKGLYLNVMILGDYEFSYDKIIKIEKVGWNPIIGWGIQIHYRIKDYPNKIIFWCFRNPEKLKREIELIIEIENNDKKTFIEKFEEINEIEKITISEELPIKSYYKIVGFLLWICFFILDFSLYIIPQKKFPGPFIILALLGATIITFLLRFNEKFKKLILIDITNYKKSEANINLILLVLSGISLGFLISFL